MRILGTTSLLLAALFLAGAQASAAGPGKPPAGVVAKAQQAQRARATPSDRVNIGRRFALDPGWRRVVNHVRAEMDAAPKGTKFVYASGPISTGKGSVRGNLKAGRDAVAAMRARGLHVISPFEIEGVLRDEGVGGFEQHASFMKIYEHVLSDPRVESLVLLPGAETSVGAAIETSIFIRDNRPIRTFQAQKDGFALRQVKYDPKLSRVEHTVLGGEATTKSVRSEARWAAKSKLRAMVVRPEHIETVGKAVRGSRTVAASVIGFPAAKFAGLEGDRGVGKGTGFARVPTKVKLADARKAIDGAQKAGLDVLELDMILDVHALRAGDLKGAQRDIEQVVAGAKQYGKARGVSTKVKVILETSLLTPREVKVASAIVRDTDAMSVKTSTGFGARGASIADVKAMRRVVGDTKIIKVSGGVSASNFDAFAKFGDIAGMSKSRELAGQAGGSPGGY